MSEERKDLRMVKIELVCSTLSTIIKHIDRVLNVFQFQMLQNVDQVNFEFSELPESTKKGELIHALNQMIRKPFRRVMGLLRFCKQSLEDCVSQLQQIQNSERNQDARVTRSVAQQAHQNVE